MSVEYLHTMIRISDVDAALNFFCNGLGLKEIRRVDNEAGRFTLVFLASPEDIARHKPDPNETGLPPGLPMLAYKVDDIYAATERFQKLGVTINRPPRDGRMCFVRSPDGISVELLQKGDPLPPKEPWASAENIGSW